MNKSTSSIQRYVFDFSEEEAQQLQLQSQLLLPATRRFLEDAGITSGMKVLDVGSGVGDVALLLAELVGPAGTVVGIENNPAALHTARTRAQAAEYNTISFVEGDLTRLLLNTGFDAVVGRYILQHLKNPAIALRHLVRHLHPGGIVAFQEADLTFLGTCVPSVPLFEQVGNWVKEAFHRAGLDNQMGLRLYRVFIDAGLPAPQIYCETCVGAGPDWPQYDVIAGRVRSLLPVILKHGIATEEEIEIDTLSQRLRDAVVSQRSIAMAPNLVSAWTHIESVAQ
jgi:2-polyprenyl-3-methyl-5-hydroxy-6-metoxy-1,4-benzoquinol methylase